MTVSSKWRFFEECVVKSWWVFVFFLVCYLAYDYSIIKKRQELIRLHDKLLSLNIRKEKGLQLCADLELQISSQQDRDWIELVLKRRLGLVSESELKVMFKQKEA